MSAETDGSRDRLAVLSVDLDEIDCYAGIHGLDVPTDERAHAIYDKAIPRFEAFFDEARIRATFFVIGRDLQRDENKVIAARLHRGGHELANHSYGHRYDLTRLSPVRIREEIARGGETIEAATGARVVGFRAPGYTTNDVVLGALSELGYAYDSSVFPCPAYYTAKAVALATITLRGRTSRSILDDPRVLSAPASPYRVGHPYWTRGNGMLELPIGVTRDTSGRLPYIGTSVVLGGARGADVLTRLISGRAFVNLELHGIDLADRDEDELTFLAAHQPDLRRSATEKRDALRAAVSRLRANGYRFVTLAEAARAINVDA